MDARSKGDYSRHIREALMVVEKLPEVNPPSDRVSDRFVGLFRSWNHCGGGTEEDIEKRVPSQGFIGRGVNIGQRGEQEVGQATQAATWHGQGVVPPPRCL